MQFDNIFECFRYAQSDEFALALFVCNLLEHGIIMDIIVGLHTLCYLCVSICS